MMKLPIALQLYSVRTDMKEDFRGALKKVAEMGYDGVEFAGFYDNDPKDVKAWCAEYGLTPISAHVALQDMLADLPAVIRDYQAVGVKYIAVPYLPEELRPDTDQFLPTVEKIRGIAAELKKAGIVTLYHNHDFEFHKVNGEYGLDLLYRLIPAELLQTELDTCWVNVGGEDPAGFIRKYANRCPVVHLKDFYRESANSDEPLYELIGIKSEKKESGKKNFEFRPVGHGLQDIPSILKASEESGAEWLVVEQDEPSMEKSRMECARMSIEYLKSLKA